MGCSCILILLVGVLNSFLIVIIGLGGVFSIGLLMRRRVLGIDELAGFRAFLLDLYGCGCSFRIKGRLGCLLLGIESCFPSGFYSNNNKINISL